MRALVATPNGSSPTEIREADEPTPGPGEVLIDVKAASLNRGELGHLTDRPGWRPGQDIAGVVVAAFDGSGPQPGTRVVALVDQAGWAERAVAPITRTAAIPDNVDFSAAATLGIAGLTALRALRVAGPLLGASVLVTGASGGVGRFAVQLAALAGALVTGSAANAERSRGLSELGAAHVVHDGGDLGGPFDLVMEGVGGPSLTRSVQATATSGLVVLYGAVTGAPGPITLADFGGHPGVRIQGFFIYETGVSTFGRDLAYMARLMGEGKLTPQIGLQVGWRELGRAIVALRNRQVNGKVVLAID
jgi:NADPH2:quinone reductase